ncbi:MAG TPA: hypothetical protein VGH59_04040 [Casimicrobiaceae bacterium]
MSRWQDQPRDAHERVTIRTIWLTLALSLLVHIVALLVWLPHLPIAGNEPADEVVATAPVQVQLAPQARVAPPVTAAPPDVPRETQAAIAPPVRPPKVVPRTPPRQALVAPTPAPAIVAPPPSPVPPTPTPPTPPVAATPPPPATGDLASFIEARRRARGEAPSEDPDEQYKRNLAANLPRAATGAATQQPKNGGGIFEIKRMAYDDAVFEFYGWNRDVGRRTPQVFEVRKGNNPDMHLAVVRRMIVIIREHEKEDFVWESHRLGRNVTLSARERDTAALEEFMLHEFFDGGRVY